MAAGEKNRAAAIVMNAEIWRTKAWLIEELALKKPCRIFGELHLPHCCPPRLPRMQYSQPSDYEKSGGGQARHLFDGMLKREHYCMLGGYTGHPVLVYMATGRFAHDIEKLSDEEVVNFVML
ncbi:uncharacterized protein LOC103720339 isoform X3 [Phoenix dactylifera]|uniref:Uncharacterized protein LOC103720339 isoform X3 n=1 Tax=Phoenix dactylifera TaxID=42345 RepID=A0A8B7CWT4_PHODC|nr:uncharacterized protein LOC103720339 isoform X3 [Phoenix dactylifera]